MSVLKRDERLEHIAQRLGNINGDSDSYRVFCNEPQINSSSTFGLINSGIVNGDKASRVTEVVKKVIIKDTGDTDDHKESIIDLKTSKGSSEIKRNQEFIYEEIGFQSVEQLKADNDSLKNNLYKVEDDLIHMKSERDILAIKYNALKEKINTSLFSDKSPGRRMSTTSEDCSNITTMVEWNLKLRQQLDDDHRTYKQQLLVQQQQQLKQVELVKRLQNKLIDLEGADGLLEKIKNENEQLKKDLSKVQNAYTISTTDLVKRLDCAEHQLKSVETNRSMDRESLLVELKEVKSKFDNLAQINTLLREQLDEATNANLCLTEDVKKVSEDWQLIRNELEQKEFECKDDEAAFSRYLASEQSRIKSLWTNVSYFKRQFNDIKTVNERDLNQIRVDLENTTQSLRVACSNFDTNFRSKISQLELQNESEKNKSSQFENLVQQLKDDLRTAESKFHKQLGDINEQYDKVSRSNAQLANEIQDKDNILSILYQLRNGLSSDMDYPTVTTEDATIQQLITDTEAVHQALREISQIIIKDNEQIEDTLLLSDDTLDEQRRKTSGLHTNRSVSPVRMPRKTQYSTSSMEKQVLFQNKFPVTAADGTCAAVRSALQKRAIQVRDLLSKLNSMKTNAHNFKLQLDEKENERQNLETQLIGIRREFDLNNRELDDIRRECERMHYTMLMLENEKAKLEKEKHDGLEESKVNIQEIEKLKIANYELKRAIESTTDNVSEIQRNMERQIKEIERLNKTLEMADVKNNKFREEVSSLKEILNKVSFEKDVLEQQKAINVESLNRAELVKAEYELTLNKQRIEELKLKDTIHQQESIIFTLNREMAKYKVLLDKTEIEKNCLTTEKKALEQEKYGIREELLRVENEKEELHQLKHGLNESIQSVEKSYDVLQDDLSKLNCEKLELENKYIKIIRERNALSADLLQSRRDAERLSTAVQKLMKERENLYSEKFDFSSQLNARERELKENENAMFLLREEKEQLDNDIYELQQSNLRLEENVETLQSSLQELEMKRSAVLDENRKLQHEFEVELHKLNKAKETMQIKFDESEKEWNRNLLMEKQFREDDIQRLITEREKLQIEFANSKEQLKNQYTAEIDDVRLRLNKEKDEITGDIITIQRERDDYLMEAEISKQHIIRSMEQEKNSLTERISFLSNTLKMTVFDLDRTRLECEARTGQDHETIQLVNADLKKLRIQFEQTLAENEREIKNLQNAYKDLENLSHKDKREIEELNSLLKIAGETRDCIRQDLADSLTRIREIDDDNQRLRREWHDEKRNYFEEKKEAETLQTSNKELRQNLKQLETSRIELQRLANDFQHKFSVTNEQKSIIEKELKESGYVLKETEKARQDVCLELENLRIQMKQLDTERGQLVNEVSCLQYRISVDEDKGVKTRKENIGIKEKISESEAMKEELSKKLYQCQRRIDDLKEIFSSKEIAYAQNYDILFKECKQLEELKTNYEQQLQSCKSFIDELNSTIFIKDDKINTLENSLASLDQKRKDDETRLALIHSHLRKLIGFRQQTVSTVSNPSYSPQRHSRSISPDKGRTSALNSVDCNKYFEDRKTNNNLSDSLTCYDVPGSDLEPEAVRMALKDITEHILNLEKERDHLNDEFQNLSLKHQETIVQLDQALQRICMMQFDFYLFEEDNKSINDSLVNTQMVLNNQDKTILSNNKEIRTLLETVAKQEKQLLSFETDKQYMQNRFEKLRKDEVFHENEKRSFIKAVDDAEKRCTQSELLRRGIEVELQRCKMNLNDKEIENQMFRERLDSLIKLISDLESKSQSLQLTIDRLSINLASTEEEENIQKDKVHNLYLTMNENQNNIQCLQENMQQLQNSLLSSEKDRRMLQEHLEALKHNLSETKLHSHDITDKLQTAQQQLSESESRKNELETEIKHLNQNFTKHLEIENELQDKIYRSEMEKNVLSEKLTIIASKLVDLESDRKSWEKKHSEIDKDRNILKNTLDKLMQLEKTQNRSEEIVTWSLLKRNELDDSIRRLEDENDNLQRQVQNMRNQLAEAEQCHAQRIMDLSSRIKLENQAEMNRLRLTLTSTEKTLQFREKTNYQHAKGLQEQINVLKDQLSKELGKRENLLGKSKKYKKNEKSDIEKSANSTSKIALQNILHDIDVKRHELKIDACSTSPILSSRPPSHVSNMYSPSLNVNFDTLFHRNKHTNIPNTIDRSNSFMTISLNNI